MASTATRVRTAVATDPEPLAEGCRASVWPSHGTIHSCGWPGDVGNQVEVRILMEHGEIASLGHSGDEGINQREHPVLARGRAKSRPEERAG